MVKRSLKKKKKCLAYQKHYHFGRFFSGMERDESDQS